MTDLDQRQRRIDTARSIAALSTVGFSFVLAVVIGAWFGWLLDTWLGTSPWLFLVFFFLGLVAGILNVYRSTKFMGGAQNSESRIQNPEDKRA